MVQDRTVDVTKVDEEAWAIVSEQQKTFGDASNPLPMIFTSDERSTYPKLGRTASYTAPVKMDIATSTVDADTNSFPFKLNDTVKFPANCLAGSTHSTCSLDNRRPGTTS
jgi:hypothetical protein